MPLPEALYTASQVRELDRRAIQEQGIPGYELMCRAAEASLAVLQRTWPEARRIAVICGPGNNGGDGHVLARLAYTRGLEVCVASAVDPSLLKGDAARAHADWLSCGGACLPAAQVLAAGADVVVDALLGTGITRAVDGEFAQLIMAMNAQAAPILALDIPSGLHADSGAVLGCAVVARVTVSFIGLKLGMFTGRGLAHCGTVHFDDLGIDASTCRDLVPAARLCSSRLMSPLGPRHRDAHKGCFGHVLLVGGDAGMPGSVRLAAEAALRVGAGLVSVGTHPGHAALLPLTRPEIMCHGVEAPQSLEPLLERADVLALGPGLGRRDWGRALWQDLVGRPIRKVLDADALNLLAENPVHRDDWVLTPHPGEAARLLDCTVADIEIDRPAAAARIQQRYGGICVLKGAGSLIQSRDVLWVCVDGNPGMASAGMGDVLTGVIAGLMAQWPEPDPPTDALIALAVMVHARAGDHAAAQGERGLLAGDLLCRLREVVNP